MGRFFAQLIFFSFFSYVLLMLVVACITVANKDKGSWMMGIAFFLILGYTFMIFHARVF